MVIVDCKLYSGKVYHRFFLLNKKIKREIKKFTIFSPDFQTSYPKTKPI